MKKDIKIMCCHENLKKKHYDCMKIILLHSYSYALKQTIETYFNGNEFLYNF